MRTQTNTHAIDDQTHMYGPHEFDVATLEEAIYLTRTAFTLAQTDHPASLWVTNEALDLLARLTPETVKKG